MGRMPADPDGRRKRPDHESVAAANRGGAEGDELAVDVVREGARELQRIPLSTAEDALPRRTERRGRDVNDAQLRLALVTVGDPGQRTGGYRYHRIMAAAGPQHEADVRFASLPAAPLPVTTVASAGILRDAASRSDAVLLDSIAAAATAPWIARTGRPVIAVVHQPPGGMDSGVARRWLQTRLDRLAYRSAAGFILASETLRDALADCEVPSGILRVVPPGCDVPVASGGRPDLRRGRATSLLCVANWLPRKGILELLEAVARLPSNAATLWLAGATDVDRRYASRIRSRLASDDLADRVIVRGPLPVEEVGALYAAADVFVLASFVDPYGTAWAEAMAFGLPVVGWRAGNLPHLAAHGREGLLVEPGDVDGLAAALRTVAEDRALRERLAAGSRSRAASFPTWERAASLFFETVRDLLRQHVSEPRSRRR